MEPLSGEVDDTAPLVISPAGILGRIPFDMLVGRNGARLVESDPMLRFVPTGRAFLNERPARQKGQLLALGGIDYEESSTETSDIKPEPDVIGTTIAAAVARGEAKDLTKRLGDGGGRFLPLNATLTEIETIERLWRDLGGGETVLKTGPNALEGILSDIKGGPRILHLATHGFVTDLDSERPGYRESLGSGIALAGANRLLNDAAKAAGLDGIVFGYEIEAMDLTDTELVVVSSCDSGSGVADENEGIYSLVRAFRLAGATMSLVTLRPVDDDLTAQFMEEFYSAWLSDGQSGPADALARVKRSWAASRDRRRSNPRSWAPFLLVENGF
jgi:CHAT domain-containing protein